MPSISLKRLLSKRDSQILLDQLMAMIAEPLAIQDCTGLWLVGESVLDSALPSSAIAPAVERHGITLNGEVLGWVLGSVRTQSIALLLSHLAHRELEKKTLAQEALDRYKELTLLYRLSEKMTANLEPQAIGELVLQETRRLIRGECGVIILLNSAVPSVEIVASCGDAESPLIDSLQSGILSAILASGKSEIVNHVAADPRHIPDESVLQSLIAAPLKSNGHVIGLIAIGSQTPIAHTAGELKLLDGLATATAAALENAQLHQQKIQEERIKSNLERYISGQLVQAILAAKGEISLTPTRRQISILFSDIRNFTTQCEELEPELIVGYLNEYFTHMVEEIFNHQGTVNKFVGDMIVALFGAPAYEEETEKRAIETAIAMQNRIQTSPNQWIRGNFHTGIGISTGEVIVGNIGSPQHMDYTAIGDEVNTASRLQSLALGGQILVSHGVYEKTNHLFQFKHFGSVQLKGKRRAIDVFEVMG